MKETKNENTSLTDKLIDIIIIIAIIFVAYLFNFSNVPFDKMHLFLRYILLPSSVVYQAISLILTTILIVFFQIKTSGNLFDFFFSNKNKRRQYLLTIFKNIGFKSGTILKRWPYYLMAFLILAVAFKILTSKNFSYELLQETKFYFLSLGFGIYTFTEFLTKALIFFTIFNYFLVSYKSIKLAYIYSSLITLFTLLIMIPITSQISIIDVLKESLVIEPFMIAMYYWSDNSIYYSWILMSTIQTLGLIYYAIKFGIV